MSGEPEQRSRPYLPPGTRVLVKPYGFIRGQGWGRIGPAYSATIVRVLRRKTQHRESRRYLVRDVERGALDDCYDDELAPLEESS